MPENRIKEFRKARRLTLEQLAERVKVSQPHLSRLEANKRLLLVPLAERIAKELGASTSEILGLAPEDEPRTQGAIDELTPYKPKAEDPLDVLRIAGRRLYTVQTRALEKIGIHIGDVVAVDESDEGIRNVRPLQAVLVRLSGQAEERSAPVALLRQFIPPRLLITNSASANGPSIDMDDEDAEIVGVVTDIHRRLTY